jgi:protein SCO1
VRLPGSKAILSGLWMALLGASACTRGPEPLPVYNTVGPFQMTSQNGEAFDSRSLRGKVWLASFFFTSCTGPCPRLNRAVFDLQEATYQYPDLRLISISIDPERDTPEALAAYAKRYKADAARWTFLTGPMATVDHLSGEVFRTGRIGNSQTHSTRVMLIDRRGRVRGFFETGEESDIGKLRDGIEKVYREGD